MQFSCRRAHSTAQPGRPDVAVFAASGRRRTRSLEHTLDLLRSFIRQSPLPLRLC